MARRQLRRASQAAGLGLSHAAGHEPIDRGTGAAHAPRRPRDHVGQVEEQLAPSGDECTYGIDSRCEAHPIRLPAEWEVFASGHALILLEHTFGCNLEGSAENCAPQRSIDVCDDLSMGWEPGEVVVHQEVWHDRVWAARPLVVVEDSPERMLLWIPEGTMRKVPMTPPTRDDPGDRTPRIIEMLHHRDWVHIDHVWDVSSLWILHPGDWHAVWISFLPSWEQLGWYINLQRPFRRTAIGIESMDMMLDVVAGPDRSWSWKDDDEFEQILQRGIFDQGTGARVRAEAMQVIRALEANGSPFDQGWAEWRPDPSWPTPLLQPGWDEASL